MVLWTVDSSARPGMDCDRRGEKRVCGMMRPLSSSSRKPTIRRRLGRGRKEPTGSDMDPDDFPQRVQLVPIPEILLFLGNGPPSHLARRALNHLGSAQAAGETIQKATETVVPTTESKDRYRPKL